MKKNKEFEKLIEEKTNVLKSLQEEHKHKKLYEKSSSIEKELFEIKKQFVIESDVLKEAVWAIRADSSDGICLIGKDSQFKRLCKLIQFDFHCRFDLEPGVKLHFDDWDITITFKDSKTAIQFIKDRDLKTNLDSFKTQRDKLKEDYESLDKFIARF